MTATTTRDLCASARPPFILLLDLSPSHKTNRDQIKTRDTMSEQSSSSKTASKASTRTKGKHFSETPQENEKRAFSEIPEPEAGSSADFSALKFLDVYDDTSVDAEDNEDIEAGSRVPMEAASGSPSTQWWPQSKFQRCYGLTLCLIVVGISIAIIVGQSGGMVL
jgi:hypothetical protein